MKPSRAQLINLHLVVASFFLPFAMMFLVTGALYTIAIKGSSTTRQEVVPIAAPLTAELGPLVTTASAALKQLGLGEPSGEASIRKAGDSFQLEWTGVKRDVILKPTANPSEALLEIKEATLYRRLVQLHKAKGNVFAKAVSLSWCVGLAAMFVSGLAMAWASDKHRNLALRSGAAGVVLFLAYYFLG